MFPFFPRHPAIRRPWSSSVLYSSSSTREARFSAISARTVIKCPVTAAVTHRAFVRVMTTITSCAHAVSPAVDYAPRVVGKTPTAGSAVKP